MTLTSAPGADTSPDLSRARERLRRRERDILAELEVLDPTEARSGSELSHLDQHPAERGSELAEADREEAVCERALAHLEEIRAALARIEADCYGCCIGCGTPIDLQRLDHRPEVARCTPCQAHLEHGGEP